MSSSGRRPIRRSIAGLTVAALLAGACGSDDTGDTGDATTADAPAEEQATESSDEQDAGSATTVADTGAPDTGASETTEAVETPSRVVSLSATHTEILFAIGAGEQLVAVDQTSNFPAGALELPNELDAFEPSVEAIAEFDPDLVIIGGDFTGLGPQLDELGIDWWDGPTAASLADTYDQIEQLGVETGRVAEASALVAEMRSRIDAIVADAAGAGEGLSFYHEIDGTFFTADSTTFIGQLYSLLGLRNIADADTSESFGFPQLNAEFIIEQDPDLIFLPVGTFYLETAEDVASRPGWDAVSAVRNGNVVETDDEIAGRWGPRVVDYLATIAEALRNTQPEATTDS